MDSIQKIIEEMRSKLYPLHGQTDDGNVIVTSAELESWASRLEALQGKVVGYKWVLPNGNTGLSEEWSTAPAGSTGYPVYAAPPQAEGIAWGCNSGPIDKDAPMANVPASLAGEFPDSTTILAAAEVKQISDPAAKPGKE